MARMARVVVPFNPHHITQRGNRSQKVFFNESDYFFYLSQMKKHSRKNRVKILAYCLMPNHIHLVAVPETEPCLTKAISEPHRLYSCRINTRNDWRGHLWQGRYASFPMDETHLLMCARYIELNPLRAKLVEDPRDWKWSSVRAHLAREDDELVQVEPLIQMVPDWLDFLRDFDHDIEPIRKHSRTGRPLGSDAFIKKCELILNRILKKQKPGRKVI